MGLCPLGCPEFEQWDVLKPHRDAGSSSKSTQAHPWLSPVVQADGMESPTSQARFRLKEAGPGKPQGEQVEVPGEGDQGNTEAGKGEGDVGQPGSQG